MYLFKGARYPFPIISNVSYTLQVTSENVKTSCFKPSSKNLVKEDDFENSLMKVVIIKMNKKSFSQLKQQVVCRIIK